MKDNLPRFKVTKVSLWALMITLTVSILRPSHTVSVRPVGWEPGQLHSSLTFDQCLNLVPCKWREWLCISHIMIFQEILYSYVCVWLCSPVYSTSPVEGIESLRDNYRHLQGAWSSWLNKRNSVIAELSLQPSYDSYKEQRSSWTQVYLARVSCNPLLHPWGTISYHHEQGLSISVSVFL